MKRNKRVYENYVCPICYRELNNCICKYFPPYTALWIDKELQEHIIKLNDKGYKTGGCCSSHPEENKLCIYVAFIFPNDFDTLPDGFKYIKSKNTVAFDISSRLSLDEQQRIKAEKLKEFMKWIDELQEK